MKSKKRKRGSLFNNYTITIVIETEKGDIIFNETATGGGSKAGTVYKFITKARHTISNDYEKQREIVYKALGKEYKRSWDKW